jgi:hypothetical protein
MNIKRLFAPAIALICCVPACAQTRLNTANLGTGSAGLSTWLNGGSGNRAAWSALPLASATGFGVMEAGSGLTASSGIVGEAQPIAAIGSGLGLSGGTLSETLPITAAGSGIAISSGTICAALPADYISGLQLAYASAGAYGEVTVSSGTAVCPSPSPLTFANATVTVSGAGLTAANGAYTYSSTYGRFFLNGATSTGYTCAWNSTASQWAIASTTTGGIGTVQYADTAAGQSPSLFPNGATWTPVGASPAAPGVSLSYTGATWTAGNTTTVTVTGAGLSWTPTTAPAASAFTYLYLTSAGSLTESPNAPYIYQGTARCDANGDRYLGCVLAGSGGVFYPFVTDAGGNRATYTFEPSGGTGSPPFEVLSSGASTSVSAVSCASVTPATSELACVELVNRSFSSSASCAANVGAYAAVLSAVIYCPPAFGASAWMYGNGTGITPTNSSQTIGYVLNNAPTTNGLQINVYGFVEAR